LRPRCLGHLPDDGLFVFGQDQFAHGFELRDVTQRFDVDADGHARGCDGDNAAGMT
jgi:hypothetical protein